MSKPNNHLDLIRGSLRYNCNLALCDFLLGLSERKIVSVNGVQFMRLSDTEGDEVMFLPIMVSGQPSRLVNCNDEMREFYSSFDGLRETKPPMSGGFVPSAEIHSLGSASWFESFPEYKEHSKCPIVFSALNGDKLIQTPNAGFAWCVTSEHTIRKVASSFAVLLERYVRFRSLKDGHPFDSYGR
jgi:hypothetical protein